MSLVATRSRLENVPKTVLEISEFTIVTVLYWKRGVDGDRIIHVQILFKISLNGWTETKIN